MKAAEVFGLLVAIFGLPGLLLVPVIARRVRDVLVGMAGRALFPARDV